MEHTNSFRKKHTYLVCIDSDGCAIDGMTVKHVECFGACAIEEWNLEKYRKEVLEYWLQINLYTLTRGINRFKGMLLLLQYMRERRYLFDDIQVYERWVNTTKELSNASLEGDIANYNNDVSRKVLSWSKKVNVAIANLPNEKKLAFHGVKETLELAYKSADIAVISAANACAVEEEWSFNELKEYVNVCMTQEDGDKGECIRKLIEKGEYQPENVIMVGDALGDFQAAEKNQVLFYPIQVGKEVESWNAFRETILELFLSNQYSKERMEEFYLEFQNNLV